MTREQFDASVDAEVQHLKADGEAKARRAEFIAAMMPDPTKEGIFRDHVCGGCDDGERECHEGDSRNCSWPRARND